MKSVIMGTILRWVAPRDDGKRPGIPSVHGGEALVAAVVEGTASRKGPLSMGLPTGEPLVGNWSMVNHLLEGWNLPQLGRGGDTGSSGISPHEIEDCSEALRGRVAARMVGCLFLEIVEGGFRRKRHFSDAWGNCVMIYRMPLRKRDSY